MRAAVIALAAVLIIGLIWATHWLAEREPRRRPRRRLRLRRRRDVFADPADTTDPDGELFLYELHHEEWPPLPAAGRLDMLPPDPPPADTTPLPRIICELGMPAEEYIDMLFEKYREKVPNG